jgi:hypothetical protein
MRSFRAFTCLAAFLSSYLLYSLNYPVAFAAANDLK